MSITKSWLLDRKDIFWNDLIYLLGYISPHFGKLNWKFNPKLKNSGISYAHYDKLSEEWTWLKEIPQQISEAEQDKEEVVLKTMMINIFSVAPDYNRTPLSYLPLPSITGLTDYESAYPRYYVRTATDKDCRPLKEEEIHEEDIKLFKHKVFIAGAKWSEQQGKLALAIARKLPHWINLINNRHQSNI